MNIRVQTINCTKEMKMSYELCCHFLLFLFIELREPFKKQIGYYICEWLENVLFVS